MGSKVNAAGLSRAPSTVVPSATGACPLEGPARALGQPGLLGSLVALGRLSPGGAGAGGHLAHPVVELDQATEEVLRPHQLGGRNPHHIVVGVHTCISTCNN